MDDFLTSVALAVSPELKINRLETLEVIKNKKHIIVTNLMGYLRFLPDKNQKDKLELNLQKNKNINRDNFIKLLDEFGYTRESIVTATGEYAVRGFIIDIFPVHDDHPIRIELFGNEIESLRYFDETSQLSINELTEFNLLPYQEIKTSTNSSLYDYCNNPLVIFINESQINANYLKLQEDIFDYKIQEGLSTDYKFMFDLRDINPKEICYISIFKKQPN